MVDLSKWAIWGCKIIKMKIFPWTVLKILVSMHSPFCPIWRTFLPVYNQPSKTVQGKFFILMILHAHIAHLLKSTIEMSCTIILLRSSLQWGVDYQNHIILQFQKTNHDYWADDQAHSSWSHLISSCVRQKKSMHVRVFDPEARLRFFSHAFFVAFIQIKK